MAPREVHQSEVARLTVLALALALAVPVLRGAERAGVATAFLAEFSNDAWPVLSALTGAPVERPRALSAGPADAFTPRMVRSPTPLVLVHGATAEGKDDPRARRAARLLASAGFDVTLPTIPGLTRGRLRPDDATPVIAAVLAADRPVVVVAVSVGSGPALLAAADPRVRDRVSLVVTLGGYGSASELVRFYLSGEYGYGGVSGHRRHDPELVRAFVAANSDVAADPAGVRDLLETLSPVRVARDVTARLLLVHARDDAIVPFTESLRLADAAIPARTTLVIVDAMGHIGAAGGGPDWRALGALWSVAYRLMAAR
jgi:pimeloyl-ACP methyl ester carboxylesterase